VIRTVFFGESAFANMATNKRPACKAAILRILIKPTPPNTADASVSYLIFPNDCGSQFRRFGTFSSPWHVPHNSSRRRRLGRTDSTAGHRPKGAGPPFLSCQYPQAVLAVLANFSDPATEPRRARFQPAGVRGRSRT
jgi:hypothetical protein